MQLTFAVPIPQDLRERIPEATDHVARVVRNDRNGAAPEDAGEPGHECFIVKPEIPQSPDHHSTIRKRISDEVIEALSQTVSDQLGVERFDVARDISKRDDHHRLVAEPVDPAP